MLYRLFLGLFICLIFSQNAYASRTVVTQSPYYNPYAYTQNPYAYNNPYAYRQMYNRTRGAYQNGWYSSNLGELSGLEKYAFNKSYAGDSNLNRLQRLERQAFGTIQQGDFDTRYENVRSAILSRPKTTSNSSVWKNIGDYFSGQMTGFTPSITPYPAGYSYNPYPQTYGNTSVTEYSSPFGGHGSRIKNYGTSSGTGITILD